MLDKKLWNQYGRPRTESVRGITIHNTGNSLSAKELEHIMSTTPNHYATHYFVDDVECIKVMPLDWGVWHTGKGFDMGNMRTIAIEICKSDSNEETYFKAQKRAIRLIKRLMKEYEITKDNIYFHNDFNNTYCPHRILDIYKTKANFVGKEFK